MTIHWEVIALLIGGGIIVGVLLFIPTKLIVSNTRSKRNDLKVPATTVLSWIVGLITWIVISMIQPWSGIIIAAAFCIYCIVDFYRQPAEQKAKMNEAIAESERKPLMRSLKYAQWILYCYIAFLLVKEYVFQ